MFTYQNYPNNVISQRVVYILLKCVHLSLSAMIPDTTSSASCYLTGTNIFHDNITLILFLHVIGTAHHSFMHIKISDLIE